MAKFRRLKDVSDTDLMELAENGLLFLRYCNAEGELILVQASKPSVLVESGRDIAEEMQVCRGFITQGRLFKLDRGAQHG